MTDKPYPRGESNCYLIRPNLTINCAGEILIGGGNVASCYYKLPEKTSEEFVDDSEGRRWFRTGDIGQFDQCGTLKIIDRQDKKLKTSEIIGTFNCRKKDLVKLQFGEYVSLGKVESVLKGCPIVNDICIYGDSSKSFVVALVCPARPAINAMAARLGKENLTFEQLCQDKDITGGVLRDIINQVTEHHLSFSLILQ